MKILLAVSSLVLLLFVTSCGWTGRRDAKQQDYDVVQEGSGGSVSTAIGAPGEQAPTLETPPMTDTDADTTTAFSIVGTDTTITSTDPSLATRLPDQQPEMPMRSGTPVVRTEPRPETPAPRPAPAPAPARPEPQTSTHAPTSTQSTSTSTT
ncbi:MAG: hypothetical protein WBX15_02535, partial [Thermoanaerobaculia bacterium]